MKSIFSKTVWPHDAAQSARIVLACLDLTSLGERDAAKNIERLCRRANSPFGPVAAVCVWPRLAALARAQLPAPIGVAAVANFPHGSTNVLAALREIESLVDAGAQEVDVVLPFRALMAGDEAAVCRLLTAVRQACPGLLLKVILETSELKTTPLVARASALALDHGADFLSTSTGRSTSCATPEAAQVMLAAIATSPAARSRVGFKISGGVRTVQQAVVFGVLTTHFLGADAITRGRFRIGASSLLADIETVLKGLSDASPTGPGAY